MAHLVEVIRHVSFEQAIIQLQLTHDALVQHAIMAQRSITVEQSSWGIETKRLSVDLPQGTHLIGKSSEKFVELINIIATTERTISALYWLADNYPTTEVKECHASTSDDKNGNDIVLVDKYSGQLKVRCEVTDVASTSAGQNGKEKKDLKTLGCETEVPEDGIDRFIATSHEFAMALTSIKRKWNLLHYRYQIYESTRADHTTLLKIVTSID